MKAVLVSAITFFSFFAPAKELAVERSTIWVDQVNQSDLAIVVRGGGLFNERGLADLAVPEAQSRHIHAGLKSMVAVNGRTLDGRVEYLASSSRIGHVTVGVRLDAHGAGPIAAGSTADGWIEITTLKNVIWVGRPVTGRPESEGTLFRVDPDGRHATRVKVFYGQASVNKIQIVSGLNPGDKIILSDLPSDKDVDRLTLN